MSRRSFLQKSALASSVLILPRHVLGGAGYTPPSDRLNLAAIGAGGKGTSDIHNASVDGRERVAALCDADFAGSASRSVERIPDAKRYSDYRVMLDEMTDIDAVTIRSYMLSKEDSDGYMEFFARRKLLWDGENKRITNVEEANQIVGQTYGEGWEV